MDDFLLRLVQEELEKADEVSTSAGAPGYLTPKAFDQTPKERSKRKHRKDTMGYNQMAASNKFPSSIAENRYYAYKKSEGTSKQKIGRSIQELGNALNELDRILKMNARLKTESGTSADDLWKRTNTKLLKIETRLLSMANKIRDLRS